jgi:Arc/MetJ-type ribon-helix-helix transcriptional regulator
VILLALIRKHFQLTKKQVEFLTEKAKPEEGISESHVVRKALNEYIEREERGKGNERK